MSSCQLSIQKYSTAISSSEKVERDFIDNAKSGLDDKYITEKFLKELKKLANDNITTPVYDKESDLLMETIYNKVNMIMKSIFPTGMTLIEVELRGCNQDFRAFDFFFEYTDNYKFDIDFSQIKGINKIVYSFCDQIHTAKNKIVKLNEESSCKFSKNKDELAKMVLEIYNELFIGDIEDIKFE